MNQPNLGSILVGEGKWAQQSGRGVNLVDEYGRLVSRLVLTSFERAKLVDFEKRLAKAWEEYEKATKSP